ncbi:PIG2 GSY2-interacting protein PIG2 [Candida maltosa Xu316]
MIDWELTLANFPPLSYLRKIESGTPVFLEKMFISNDKKNLLGYIAVKNLAFEKHLTVRYSLDHWLTIIELPTIYLQERPEVLKLNDYDRFMFKIPLNNLFNSIKFSKDSSTDSLENNDEDGSCHERAYQMCIKYDANFHEYWDNNNFNNYEIKLKRSIIQPPSRHPRQQHQTLIGSQIQEHTKKPRYSNSYLKRVASDSDITIKSSSSASSSGSLSKHEPMEMDQDHDHDDDEDVDMQDPNSSEISDFVKNNYYLSSPLLSSLHKNPDITDDYFTNSKTNSNSSAANNKNGSYTTTTNNNSNNASSDHAKYKAKFQPHLSKLDTSDFNRNFMDDESKQSSSANNNGTSKTTTITNPKPIKTSTSTNLGPSFTGLTASNRNKFLNSKSYKELLENYCFFSSDTQDCDPTTTTSTTNSRNNSSSSSSSSEDNEKITRNGSFTVSSFLGT